MWSTVASSAEERAAFYGLLDEYFQQDRPASSSQPKPLPRRQTPAPPAVLPPQHVPVRTPYFPPVPAAPEPEPTPSPAASSFSTRASNFAAKSALQNQTLTSSALRSAGFSPSAATAASKIGSQHAEVLAPHLAAASRNAAKEGWNQREGIANAATGTPPPVKPKGPQVPAGLMSTKSIAGGFSTQSGKAFGSSLLQSKGPMSKEEAKKNVFKEPLATKAPPRTYGAASSSFAPPPIRGAVVVPVAPQDHGLGSAEALYEYTSDEPDDLPVVEGQRVTVIEHVSADWWRCRSVEGREGLVPATYLKAI